MSGKVNAGSRRLHKKHLGLTESRRDPGSEHFVTRRGSPTVATSRHTVEAGPEVTALLLHNSKSGWDLLNLLFEVTRIGRETGYTFTLKADHQPIEPSIACGSVTES